MANNDIDAFLDEAPQSSSSSIDSFLDDDTVGSFLDEETPSKSWLDFAKKKVEQAADWYVENRTDTTRAVTKPFTDWANETKEVWRKGLDTVNEGANAGANPTGNMFVDAAKPVIGAAQMVGGAIRVAGAPVEAAITPAFKAGYKLDSSISDEDATEMARSSSEGLTMGLSMVPTGGASAASKVTTKASTLLPKETAAVDEFLGTPAIMPHTEALGQVAMGARNPFTLTEEQFAANLAEATPKRTAAEIQAEINLVAKDTSIPGAKERLSALQAEKANLKPTEFPKAQAKLTDQQFETNIAWPTQNALDSGASVESVRATLKENLATNIKDPAYVDELVNRAVPDIYLAVDKTADDVAKTYGGVESNTARGIMDTSTPDDGAILTGPWTRESSPLDEAVAAIKEGETPEPVKLKGRFRSRLADSTNMISLLGQQWAKRNGTDIGTKSLREYDDWTAARNMSQRGNAWWKSIIGNPNGKDQGILWPSSGSELVADSSIDNFSASITKARSMGLEADDMREVMQVYNAYDDYANIDRMIAKAQQQIAAGNDVKHWTDVLNEFSTKETYMTRAEVEAGVAKYADNEAAQYFLGNKNKINQKLLLAMADSGRISVKEANAMIEAHPNYVPAWREVDDFTFANVEVHNAGGSVQPFKFRKVSDKKALQDPIAANANSIINTVRKIEQTNYRAKALDYVMKNSTDEDFAVLFREPKAAVEKAIQEIQNGGKQRWSAEELLPTKSGRVQHVGNITFDVGGGQIQLTIPDADLFQEFSQSRMWEGTNSWYEKLVKVTNFKRSFIVLNPEFSVRNFQRETMDAMVSAKTSFWQKVKYPASNVKNLFAKETNPELYDHIVNNIGYGSRRGQNLQGKSVYGDEVTTKLKDVGVGQIMTEVAEGTYKQGALSKTTHSLEALANRFDMAPRITLYEWMMRDGLKQGMSYEQAHEAAIFSARNLGVNFTQRGSNAGFDKALRVIPFARSFINSTDRLVHLGRYEPARLSRNVFLLYGAYATVGQYNGQFKDADGIPYIDKLDPNIKKDILPIYGPWSEGVNDYFPMRLGWVYGRALPKMDTTASYLMQEIGSRVHKGIESDVPSILAGNEETKAIDPKEVMAAWTDYVTGIVSPTSMLPPGASDAMALATNKDFQGKPIVPEYLKDSPSWAQYTDQTPQTLVDFSYNLSRHGIDVSPAVSQYLLNSFFSSSATYSLAAADMVYGAVSGREAPEIENRSTPFMGLITGNTSDVPREGIESQFSNVGQYLKGIKKEHDAIIKRTEVDPNAFLDLQQFEIEKAPELAYYQQWKEVSDAIAPNRDRQTAISKAKKDELQGYQTPENEILGDPEKRKGINEFRKDSIDAMKIFLNHIKTDKNAENIWYERLSRNPLTTAIDRQIPSKEIDKKDSTEYNNGPQSQKEDTVTVYKPTSNHFLERIGNSDQGAPKKGFFHRNFPNSTGVIDDMYKDRVLKNTLRLEGGYVNHPADRGGPTKYGVTLKTYREADPNATVEDIKNLTKDRAVEIYDKVFWQKAKVDSIPKELQDLVFDGNINHGVPGMTKVIQRALGDLGVDVKVNGVMGNSTLDALNQIPVEKLRPAIINRRDRLYKHMIRTDPTQKVFERGWMKRLTNFVGMPDTRDDA